MSIIDPQVAPELGHEPSRRVWRGRRLPVVVAVVLVALFAAGVVVLVQRHGPSAAERALARASGLTQERSFHATFTSENQVTGPQASSIRQSGSGDVAAGGSASKIDSVNVSTSDPASQTIDSILVGDQLYWTDADIPVVAHVRPWLSSPAGHLPGESIVAEPDPTDVLRLLRTPTADVSEEGVTRVGSGEARHYRFVLTLGDTPAQLAAAGIPPTAQVFLAPYRDDSIRADVYVGVANNEVVQVTAETSSTERPDLTGSFSDTYSNYGEPLAIVAPPADQVEHQATQP